MPAIVDPAQKEYALSLMLEHNYAQRELERITGLSRPFLRKIAREVGYQFPRNGIEVVGSHIMCCNCGSIFRRALSKITRAQKQFCDKYCKDAYQKGPNHPSWSHGKTANTFSSWIKNQAGYETWRQAVLSRYNNRCAVSGLVDNLDVHHILEKAQHNDRALDPNNGIVLNKQVHIEIHKLIREGYSFDEAMGILRKKFKETRDAADQAD